MLVFTTDPIEALNNQEYALTGTVVNIGEEAITQHGFCWSSANNPTTSEEVTQLGRKESNGTFSSTISGLSSSTVYYVRAYVITNAGTAYGKEKSFTTSGPSFPTVSTTPVGEITETTAESGGNVTDTGNSSVTARGICWSTSPNPTVSDKKSTDGAGPGAFTSSISGLDCNTTYYVRAYATNSVGTAYGMQEQFTSSECPANLPTVTTTLVGEITETTAKSGGNVTNDGGESISARGVCWSTSPSPTIADLKTSDGAGSGIFISSINGLECNTTYYVRAYATNSSGTGYGEQEQFTSSECPANLPTVTTTPVGEITETTAKSGGNVTNDGGESISARGVCWSTSPSPTIADLKTSDGAGSGIFISSINGLECNTTYYVRAYATNSSGTGYGEQEQFTSSECPANLPTVTTTPVGEITETTAESGGNVTNDGGESISARGVCWSTSPSPTTADLKTSDGAGSGTFTSSISGLECNTTYYVRAYATNSAGTGYGNQDELHNGCLSGQSADSYHNAGKFDH